VSINPTRIDLARRRRGLTKTKLAEDAGVSTRILTDYLTGRKHPSETTLARIAARLEMPVEFFSGDDLDEPPVEQRQLSLAEQHDRAPARPGHGRGDRRDAARRLDPFAIRAAHS